VVTDRKRNSTEWVRLEANKNVSQDMVLQLEAGLREERGRLEVKKAELAEEDVEIHRHEAYLSHKAK
jgi:hypothetical protein